MMLHFMLNKNIRISISFPLAAKCRHFMIHTFSPLHLRSKIPLKVPKIYTPEIQHGTWKSPDWKGFNHLNHPPPWLCDFGFQPLIFRKVSQSKLVSLPINGKNSPLRISDATGARCHAGPRIDPPRPMPYWMELCYFRPLIIMAGN